MRRTGGVGTERDIARVACDAAALLMSSAMPRAQLGSFLCKDVHQRFDLHRRKI